MREKFCRWLEPLQGCVTKTGVGVLANGLDVRLRHTARMQYLYVNSSYVNIYVYGAYALIAISTVTALVLRLSLTGILH